MSPTLAAVALAATIVAAAGPAVARPLGVPTGQHTQVLNNVARAQQQNNAAIAHVQNSIAATRRQQF